MITPQLTGFILLVVLGLAICDARHNGEKVPSRKRQVKWDTLKTTFGYPGQANALNPVPRTDEEAIKAGYVKYSKDNSCYKENYLGYRYLKNGSTTVMPLYDVRGVIAGIQTTWLKSVADQYETIYPFNTKALMQIENINGVEYYVETAYFIQLERICTPNYWQRRNEFKFEGETGTILSYQNGSSPIANSAQIPRTERDIDKTNWTKGGCFPKMGHHYFYEITDDKDCKEITPLFAMYNEGSLTGFGFVVIGNFTQSEENEHPPKEIINMFFSNVIPRCLLPLYDISKGFTTLHVFFNTDNVEYDC